MAASSLGMISCNMRDHQNPFILQFMRYLPLSEILSRTTKYAENIYLTPTHLTPSGPSYLTQRLDYADTVVLIYLYVV